MAEEVNRTRDRRQEQEVHVLCPHKYMRSVVIRVGARTVADGRASCTFNAMKHSSRSPLAI